MKQESRQIEGKGFEKRVLLLRDMKKEMNDCSKGNVSMAYKERGEGEKDG